MRAEIVSVGTELLMGQITDTNAVFLSRILPELGISLYRRTTVGDNHERLLAALKQALAEAMGDTLSEDPETRHRLEAFFRSRGMPILQSNLKQAMVPTHGRAISNPNGTAPGVIFERSFENGGNADPSSLRMTAEKVR